MVERKKKCLLYSTIGVSYVGGSEGMGTFSVAPRAYLLFSARLSSASGGILMLAASPSSSFKEF